MQPKSDGESGTAGPQSSGRRRLLEAVAVLAGATAAAMIALPAIGFLVAPILRSTPRRWRSVGSVDLFSVGSTVLVSFEDASPEAWAGVTARTGAWLRRVGDDEFIAFAINCTHLGCPVRWEDGPKLFMCPCHGGVYNADGSVAAGPPPESLRRYAVRIRKRTVEIESAPLPIT
jgi:menaquinol-cytochrome c reductase iron-sulfur subunit